MSVSGSSLAPHQLRRPPCEEGGNNPARSPSSLPGGAGVCKPHSCYGRCQAPGMLASGSHGLGQRKSPSMSVTRP